MLLRNTKKFFKKTLNGFKSLFSSTDDYQRIPKTTPPHMNIQTTYKDSDKFYGSDHFTNRWDSSSANNQEMIQPIKKNVMKVQEDKEVHQNGSFMKFANKASKRKNVHADSRFIAAASDVRSKERICLLAEMLKELELMMDMRNVDHVMDIEEFLHYYSRLTCPAYVDIVDKFFLEIYAEFFGHGSATPARITSSSRPKLRS